MLILKKFLVGKRVFGLVTLGQQANLYHAAKFGGMEAFLLSELRECVICGRYATVDRRRGAGHGRRGRTATRQSLSGTETG